MLRDQKILITGPAGQIAYPLAQYLARDNDVWGIARFSEAGSRERVEQAGVTTRVVDLATGDFGDLPDDFTYVLHLAAFLGTAPDYDAALRVNAEGSGMVLNHCRKARAAMVMTTGSIYKPHEDPNHAYLETDPLGDAQLPSVPTYSISKIAEEGVVRTVCRMLEIPTVIVRMNVAYGTNGGMPAFHLDAVAADKPISLRWDPNPYSPIHEVDICEQTEALLDVASVPATIVNWGGDDAVSAQQWCAYFGELTGKVPQVSTKPVPGTQRGVVLDVTKRRAITGPCRVNWRDGMRTMFESRYPNGVDAGPVNARSAHAMQSSQDADG
jgi:nucleoside-diphosphate-sugar epimerase